MSEFEELIYYNNFIIINKFKFNNKSFKILLSLNNKYLNKNINIDLCFYENKKYNYYNCL